ncbi:MAG TPA: hypothetical protein VMR49_01295 [Candidatus Paceibacterota bacterium]|jgi:hypothetical protein|nr:hypothetical protein [Candidatus Paceibacterota bacterium]
MTIKNIKLKKDNNCGRNGYAILFAVILVSIISVIALGLSNTTYKQLIITSVAKDSETAFYESDMATECGIYLDQKTSLLPVTGSPPSWNCGVMSNGTAMQFIVTYGSIGGTYDVFPQNPSMTSAVPCFDINIDKRNSSVTIIKANGYNICNKSNFRTVERSIETDY